MGAIYLTDLADVLRAAGLTVIEVAGWQARGRSSGGYTSGLPSHIMIHHTASPPRTDGQLDVDYIVSGSPVKPVANIYTQRNGVVWVCAAGATNTNGAGEDKWGGGVPDNAMNLCAISNEIANTGVGEPYPTVQQDSVIVSTAAMADRYGIASHCVRGHFEWTSRKIDPSGPSRWAISGKWNMDAFRFDVAHRLAPTPPPVITPPPPPSGRMVDMFFVIVTNGPDSPVRETWLLCDGTQLSHVIDGHAAALMQRVPGISQVRPESAAETAGLIRSCKTMNDCPPEWQGTGWEIAWNGSR